MTYFEWNNLIANYFFNPANAARDVYLYISKPDIIQLGQNYFDNSNENEIWQNFLREIKYELSQGVRPLSPIARPVQLYNQWDKTSTPPFLAYLILYIIPLTEPDTGQFNSNNYYGRINDFFKKHGILNEYTEVSIGTGNFQYLNTLWDSLEEWSIITKNCELGVFELKKFGNPNWVYVGKPFSQCVLPPKALKKLPELFLEAGMIPDLPYSDVELKSYILSYGAKMLSLSRNILDLIKKSDENELGQSIIDIVKRVYSKWTGESHIVADTESSERTKRNYTLARLFLQIKPNQIQGTFEYSFRIKSSTEFPEDLKFSEFDNLYDRKGYSKPIIHDFQDSFELKDNFNKWIAKFPSKEVRLFLNGGVYQFSTDYWLETDFLAPSDWMFLLCKNGLAEKIAEWGKKCCSSFIDESDLEDLPEGYSLFKLLGPQESLMEIPTLTLFTSKEIKLVDGLELSFNSFLSDYLPEIEVANATGNERLMLKYKNIDESVALTKKHSLNHRWLLPEDIILESDFSITIENEQIAGNSINYKIISADDSSWSLDESMLPKRDSFGRISNSVNCIYVLGSNTIGAKLLEQIPYQHFFHSRVEDINPVLYEPEYCHHEGNALISILTLKKQCSAELFYKSFEYLHYTRFGNDEETKDFNYSILKKVSLNFLDYLGYLDYEYETKQIVVCPPQLILIPVEIGRKALLIGGRDFNFIQELIQEAPKHKLQVEIIEQLQSNHNLLLPDAIVIKAFGKASEYYGEKNLEKFAKSLNIKFHPQELVQVALQNLSANILEYENDLLSNKLIDSVDYGWARYVFNPETLLLDKSYSEEFDKTFSLAEYRLRPWDIYCRLWINGKCYDADRNWSKYLAMKHYQKNGILYNKEQRKVAIPIELPLPRLLAESILLLSGLAPAFEIIGNKRYRIYENIPAVFIKNLFDKLSQNTIDYSL